jgi:acetyl esterase/lipase
MKRTARLFSFLSALFGLLTLLQFRGAAAVLLAGPKLIATTLSLVWLLLGSLGALLGRLRRDSLSTWLGLAGAALAARYIARVTAGHDDFSQTFGPDWQSRLPPAQQAAMLPKRWQPVVPKAAGAPSRPNLNFDIHRETGELLLADLWQPPAGVPPTGIGIIYLHGSGWHYLDKDWLTRPFFRHLSNQGHIILDVAYTLFPEASLLPIVADVKRAIAWLKTNGPAYGVNPDRIVLMGGSAGGHLSLLAGYTPNLPALQPADVQADTSVRAVISYYGAADLPMAHQSCVELFRKIDASPLRRIYDTFLPYLDRPIRLNLPYGPVVSPSQFLVHLCGGTPAEAAEMYRLGSPLSHVGPHCPPTLILQGAQDFVFSNQGRPLYQALRQAGVPVIYRELPNSEHAFDLLFPRISPAYQTATYDVERFLALLQ